MPLAPKKAKGGRQISDRWTPALAKSGWTPVSDFFLHSYAKLAPAITNAEAMLVIHLIRHKWDKDPPFPGFTTLARRMGISTTAARAHARSLERKGYLVRQMRVGTTNKFDLSLLFTALEKLQAYEQGKKDAKRGKQGTEETEWVTPESR